MPPKSYDQQFGAGYNGVIPEEWSSYVTMLGKGLEVIPAVLYSTVNYVSTTTVSLSFFDTPNVARPDLTNMVAGNMLPSPESFLIQAIRVKYQNNLSSDGVGAGANTLLPGTFEDVVKLTNNGVLNLTISNKKYGPWPLWMLPAGNSVQGQVSTGMPTASLQYGQVLGPYYPLLPNLMLAPMQQFTCTIDWPGGAQTLSQTPLPIQVMFDGQRARAIG